MVAAIARGKTVRFWDPATGKEVRALKGNTVRILDLAFSPDGKTLATGHCGSDTGGPEPGTVRLWDVATGDRLACSYQQVHHRGASDARGARGEA